MTPSITGITSDPNFDYAYYPDATGFIYGNSFGFYYSVTIEAYLYAVVEGDFIISSPESVDDIGLLWTGGNAISGWTRDNADFYTYTNAYLDQSKTYHLTAGQYLPIRYIAASSGGPGSLSLQVTTPNGGILTTAGAPTDQGSIVIVPCDSSVPAFPPFGAET
jgi:hypothetical protein